MKAGYRGFIQLAVEITTDDWFRNERTREVDWLLRLNQLQFPRPWDVEPDYDEANAPF